MFCLEAPPHAGDLQHALAHSLERIVAYLPVDLLTLDGELRPSPWKVSAGRSPWTAERRAAAERLARTTPSLTVCGLLGSHSSGFVREVVVKQLAQRGSEALPWLLARCVDWVAPVQMRAATAVLELLRADAQSGPGTEAVVAALPVANRLTGFARAHAHAVTHAVHAYVLRQPDEVVCRALAHPTPAAVRHAVFNLMHEHQRLRAHHMWLALEHGPTRQQLLAARLLGANPAETPVALCRRAFSHGRHAVRALALDAWATADAEDALPTLRLAVDDADRRVRRTARWHLAKSQGPIDFAAHYRAQLATSNPPLGAVAGLGELGARDDWERLVAMLDASSKHARAAIRSLRELDKHATRELRLMMVDDPRPGVSTEAARSVAWEIREGDLSTIDAYLTSPYPHVRRNSVPLCAHIGGWAPLVLLLQLDDPELNDAVRVQLRPRFRSCTALPATDSERALLRALLPKAARILQRDERDLGRWLDFMSRAT